MTASSLIGERLARMIRIPTVADRGPEPFEQFVELIDELYPRVHQRLERERITGLGLLYRWRGASAADPVVLMAHYDVVSASADEWGEDPFSGRVESGWVHGRGALDDKGPLLVILEAVESLLAESFTPARDVYFSFGGNEETYGDAARAIVQHLDANGVRPWLVIDEGGAVVDAPLPLTRGSAAMIGIGEKGLATLRLSAASDPGHASAPRGPSAIDRLARATRRLSPGTFRPRAPEAITRMLGILAVRASGPGALLYRILSRSRFLTGLVFAALGGEPAALVRTTIAATLQDGGTAANVLPASASVTFNVRLIPGETVASVASRVSRRVGDDEVDVSVLEGSDPTPLSPARGPAFDAIARAVAESYPAAAPTPYLMMQASDARHFHRICPPRLPLRAARDVGEPARVDPWHRRMRRDRESRARPRLPCRPHPGPVVSVWVVVGFLAAVEFTSGILQGYYTPMLTDIARALAIHDADVNWFEGTQLMLSALVVPAFARLGDMIGHKRMLLISTAVVAAASLALPFATTFWTFLICWAIQGVYVVWLPLEVALIFSRARSAELPADITAKAAGVLVAALETGAIVGALAGGALIDALDLWIVLLVPGIAVAACFFVILFGVAESATPAGGRLDTTGLVLISFALIAFTGGLSLLRINGPSDPVSWGVAILGAALIAPFVLWERRHPDPLIDVRMFRDAALWPVFLTAGLFGVSVLGAQAPLSTFARTDPDAAGYGLGASGFATSLIIGLYLIAMIIGALGAPQLARVTSPRTSLIVAAALVGVGYLLFLPMHDTYAQVVVNMVIAGIGSGALVGALPATAAAAAPPSQTGVATGLTNSVKTVGGAIASCAFGIALTSGVTAGTAGSLSGYVTVWVVCGATALAAAAALLVVPRDAFRDVSR